MKTGFRLAIGTIVLLTNSAVAQTDCLANDIALVNGQIHTMDDDDSVVSSVLIKGNRIAAMDIAVESLDGCTRIIDLERRSVIPGLIDNHVHYIRVANRPGYDLRGLEVTFTIDDALESIAQKAESVPEGGLITAIGGIRRSQWQEKRFPTVEELDAAAPNHPVYLSERGFGPGQTNSAARVLLRGLGVPVGDGGVVAMRDDTALAYEVLAANLTDEDRKRQLLSLQNYALSLGLTTVMDMSGTVPGVGYIDQSTGYDFFLDLVRDDAHKVRTRMFFPGMDENDELNGLRGYLDNKWPNYGPDMAKVVGIGEWSVGRTLFASQPLGDAARLAQRLIAERGWTYHQHLHSPAEIDAHLDVWEELDPEFDLSELRWTLGHLSQITPELIERAKALGLGLGAHGQPYHGARPRGPQGGPPWRTLLESNPVALAAGSDGTRINSINPWCIIYYMVTGRNVSGDLVNDGQQISRYDAVRLYSSADQGWFTGEDDLLGGIGVGRYADLAILEADIFDSDAVPDAVIRNMKSVLTIVNGEIVFDSGAIH